MLAERRNAEDEEKLKLAETVAREAEVAFLSEKERRHAAELASSKERGRCCQAEARATAAETELMTLQHEVIRLEKIRADILEEMDILRKSPAPQAKLDQSRYSLHSQVVLQKRKIRMLERSIDVARESAKKGRVAKKKLQKLVARRDAKIDRARRNHDEEPRPPVRPPPPNGDEKVDSEEEKARVMREGVLQNLKPDGVYGERCARMCQHLIQHGLSLNSTGPLVHGVLDFATGVDAKELGIKLDKKRSRYLPSACRSSMQESSEPLFWRRRFCSSQRTSICGTGINIFPFLCLFGTRKRTPLGGGSFVSAA